VINFKLKDFDKIVPIGQEPDLRLSWFWLTDGDLWLNFGDQTIYEYSKETIQYFDDKLTPYNDYYIVRFLEDFTQLFEKISESIPEKFYSLTENIKQFNSDTQTWLDLYDTDEDEHSDFYFEEYDKLISWSYERTLNSGHLIGGPHLSFFKCKDKIRIVWQTEHTLENGISLWTAKDGTYEMSYTDFLKEVKLFGQKFFKEMDTQIEMTLKKEWKNIKVDKVLLLEEHIGRKLEFDKKMSFLEQDVNEETNWSEIEKLYDRMRSDIE
jgi:Family of unknown function (DUF5984)